MATAHLIHGFLGAGKTTFARELEQNIPAIRFSHDEWMTRLYGDDPALLKNIRILEQWYLFLSKLSVGAQSHYVRSVASAAPAHKPRATPPVRSSDIGGGGPAALRVIRGRLLRAWYRFVGS